MLQVLRAKYRHSLGRMLILFLSLVLASGFLSIGTQLYIQSVESMKAIDENTTTIAMPVIKTDSMTSDKELELSIGISSFRMERACASSAVKAYHPGTTVAARIRGYAPVVPTNEQYFLYDQQKFIFLLYRSSLSVFRVRVDSVEQRICSLPESRAIIDYETQKINGMVDNFVEMQEYRLNATVLETVIANVSIPTPTSAVITVMWQSRDGKDLLEPGKEYYIIDRHVPMLSRRKVLDKYSYRNPSTQTSLYVTPLYPFDRIQATSWPQGYYVHEEKDGVIMGATMVPVGWDEHPSVFEVDDPRAEEFLAWAKLNSEMINVTGISTVKGLPAFAWDDATIVEGRDITLKDSREGANVCLVSSFFARHHGLAIGDTLSMDMYHTEWEKISHIDCEGVYTGPMEPTQQQDYEIVGIYQAPEWVWSAYTFSPNTIFVPEGSIHMEGKTGLRYATSLILHNGSNEQFLKDVQDMGMDSGYFAIDDGGYMEFKESLELMQKDSRMVMIVCLLLYLVVTASALYMMVQHLRQDALLMQKLGASERYAARYMLLCILPIVVLSSVTAYGLSCTVYAPVIEKLEVWYTLVRPAYSSLTDSSTGMLTSTMGRYPSAIGMAAAWGLGSIMTAMFTALAKERTAKKE